MRNSSKRLLKWVSLGMLLAVSSNTMATDTVVVGGITFTCSNSCVRSGPGGNIIRDCCGGRVFARMRPVES